MILKKIRNLPSSLNGKILILVLTSICTISLTLTILFITISYVSLKNHFDKHNEATLHKLEQVLEIPFINQDYVMIVDLIDAEINSTNLEYIWLLDKNNKIIACNDPSQSGFILDKKYMHDNRFKYIKSSYAITIAILSDLEFFYSITAIVILSSLFCLAILLFIAVIITNKLSKNITAPISLAVNASKAIADGSFNIVLPEASTLEINTLFKSLVNTANKINELTSGLKSEKNLLKISEEKYRHLIESLSDTYFFFSRTADGKLIYLSPSVRSILGYTDINDFSSFIEKKTNNPINNDVIQHYHNYDFQQKTSPYIIEILHKNGTCKTLEILESPLFNENNDLIQIEGIARDITYEKMIEYQIIQSQKMETVGSLASGIAHDFNNILGGIVGTISIIKHKIKNAGSIDTEELNNFISIMENAGQNATGLVNQLLNLSRKKESFFAATNLSESIKNVLEICNNSFDKRVKITTDIIEDNSIIFADASQIQQAILNILVNAEHAMTIMRKQEDQWGGHLSIKLSIVCIDKYFMNIHPDAEEKNYYILSIHDTGVGIEENILPKIFDPFFSTKPKGKGNGLGLAMVYSIIKTHHGFIDVYSELDKGTTFNIFLPVHQGALDSNISQVSENDLHGTGVILVIDDDPLMRVIATAILDECGYETIAASDGDEGIEIIKNGKKISAVLLDMAMPKKSGREVYMELRSINPEIKVLLASGFKLDERVQELLHLGVVDFIQKPYTMLELGLKIKKVINR